MYLFIKDETKHFVVLTNINLFTAFGINVSHRLPQER